MRAAEPPPVLARAGQRRSGRHRGPPLACAGVRHLLGTDRRALRRRGSHGMVRPGAAAGQDHGRLHARRSPPERLPTPASRCTRRWCRACPATGRSKVSCPVSPACRGSEVAPSSTGRPWPTRLWPAILRHLFPTTSAENLAAVDALEASFGDRFRRGVARSVSQALAATGRGGGRPRLRLVERRWRPRGLPPQLPGRVRPARGPRAVAAHPTRVHAGAPAVLGGQPHLRRRDRLGVPARRPHAVLGGSFVARSGRRPSRSTTR